MNAEELKKLTPEEKRIKIAEVCGWTEVDKPKKAHSPWGRCPSDPGGVSCVLNYLNSLGAMAEARKIIKEKDCQPEFITHLQDIVQAEWTDDPREVFFIVDATAAQQADAFLLTVG